MASRNIATNGAEHQQSAEQILKDDNNENNNVNRTSKLNATTNGNNGRSGSDSDLVRPESNGTVAVSLRAGSPTSKLDKNDKHQETTSKTDKIREVVEQSTSDDSKKKIEKILADVQQLSDLEKLLLYLRLPTGTKVEVDPLKQAFVSSLGNRYEVTQTVTWIQTHLEEDSEVSLPKQEVYDGYCEFCRRVNMKPLSTADFGKVMKQVFPTVRPRRLGTRGNSRYCYAGLRKKLSVDVPQLPDLSLAREESYEDCDPSDPDSTGASSYLIREWAEKLLGQKFINLKELACHLVENSYVNNRSVAAFALLSYLSETRQGKGSSSCSLLNQCAGSKHRETQLQLQRKLQERELIREQKKKLLEQKSQLERCQSEKPPSKSSRKSQSMRQHSDLPRSTSIAPSSENGSTDEITGRLADVDVSKIATIKEESESETPFPHEITDKGMTKSSTRRTSVGETKTGCTPSETPVHFPHDARSVPASPCRRKSGDASRGSSPRSASTLDALYSANNGGGWATHSLDDSCRSGSNGSSTSKISCGKTPDSFKGAASVPEINKTGKVCIPRMTCSQTSKMRFPTPTSIIILPPISSVPLTTDYGATQSKPKLKYKPIQPKPDQQRSVSEEGKTIESPVTDEKAGVVDGNNRERELSGNSSTRRETPSSSSSNSNLGNSDSAIQGSTTSYCSRKPKRSNDEQQGQRDFSKRVCHETSDCEMTDESFKYKTCKETDSGSPPEEMSISTLENDALMEYLSETPSVDQEDELLQYFGGDVVDRQLGQEGPIRSSLLSLGPQSAELSQLRKLLERNFQCKPSGTHAETSGSVSNLEKSKAEGLHSEVQKMSATKDTMPTLRLLLSEHRQTSMAVSLQQPADASRTTDGSIVDGSQNGLQQGGDRTNSFLSEHFEQQGEHGEAQISNEDVGAGAAAVDIKPPRYVINPTPDEEDGWSYEATKEGMKTEPQTLAVSSAFLNSESEITSHPLGVLDTRHENMANHHVGDRSLPAEVAPFELKPYPTCGNPLFVHHPGGQSSVPPSPNTRRRAFDFTPISPRNTPIPETRSSTQSPLPYLVGGSGSSSSSHVTSTLRHSISQTTATASSQSACATSSQPASAATSPFVSPRSTPSSLSRSRHNSGQASSSFGTPRATPHALYGTEQPSCLTSSPFVSPHPTPVPFPSRSRHNSSQNASRTCGLTYSGAPSSVSNVPSRSRHPSELGGMSLLSPGSAPMSPLEHHGGICDIDIPCGLPSGSHYSVMPSFVGDAVPTHLRSRHNSNSSVPPNSPRSAPMSPMIAAGALLARDSYSPDQGLPFGKSLVPSSPGPSSLPPPPPPPPPPLAPPPPIQRHALSTADNTLSNEDHSKLVNPLQWPCDVPRHSTGLPTETGQQSSPCWVQGVMHRQMDPRLMSRQRHASVGSPCSHHTATTPIHPHSQQTLHLDASSQEVSQLMQKPLPSPLDSATQLCNRSQSVPLYEMLQYGLKQEDLRDASFGDALMSRSYPATPTGQHSFTFRTESSIDSGVASLGTAVNSQEFSDFGSGTRGGEDNEQLYHGDQLGCDAVRRTFGDTLNLPQDQFQDMIPSSLADFTHDEITMFAQELEQFASSTQQ